MQKQFLASNEKLFRTQDPGFPFIIFKPYLPHKGSISFFTDTPYAPAGHASSEQISAAQGQLAPLLLNPAPVESTALVFCSQNAIATAQLQTTGYQATRVLGNGQFIAKRRS